MLDKFVYDSGIKGPKLLILGAIHGNEIAGSKEIFALKERLDKKEVALRCGCLVLMPVCNPWAYEKKQRFVEQNLNRIIKKYENPATKEETFANEVAHEILQNDFILDLHSTHNEGEEPFVFLDYTTEDNIKMANAVDVGFIVTNWPEIYKNAEISDYTTEYFANANGKSAITVECGYHNDDKALGVAKNTIYNVIAALGIADDAYCVKEKQKIVMKKVFIKKAEGALAKNFKHLDKISKGDEVIIYKNGEKLLASEDFYILIPNHNAEIGHEWFYYGV